MVVPLGTRPGVPRVVWCAFGPPCITAYFPVLLDGELPPALERGAAEPVADSFWWQVRLLNEQLHRDPERWAAARAGFGRLQARFDQETDEFLTEAQALTERGAGAEVPRLAAIFMQHNLEQFEALWHDLGDRRLPLRPQPSA
jgi:dipeptidase